jgi:putative ABC transport system permease protein
MRDSLLRRYRRFFGPDPKRDVDEELSFHLAMRADEYRRAGMSEQDALEATMQRFGSMREIRDEVETLAVKRNARRRRALHLDALMQDLRFAWRTLVANPGYSIVVLLTLALGIGANAAVFSVAYGVLLRPLPYRDANSIVRVFSSNIRLNLDGFSVEPSDYATWKRESPAFTAMAAFERQRDATLATRTEPQIVSMSPITPDVFALLGTSPALGRTLVAADARADAPPAAVVSHSLWTTRFGADSTLVGRDLTLDGKRYTVVGVMPPRFFVPGTNAQVWTPLFIESAPPPTGDRHLRVLGRLAPGYTVASAHAQLDVIAARIAKEIPGFSAGWSTKVSSVPEMIIGTQFRRAVLMLVGVVAFVLLIACANAANLQLARAATRERELAVRAALGASRGRITRQLLTESTLLSVVAGAAGLLLAYGGISLLRALGTTTVPRLEDVHLDAPVVWFTSVVALGSAVLFGLVPAWRGSRTDVNEALKYGGRGGATGATISSGIRSALIVGELSLSLVLLIGAGLVLRSFATLQAVDLGFEERQLLLARTTLPSALYPQPDQVSGFLRDALARARSLGGVTSVAAVSSAPFAGPNSGTTFARVDHALPAPSQAPGADLRVVTPGYFRTMKIPLIDGRDFTDEDRVGAPNVVIIGAEMARRHWPNENPIGHGIRVGNLSTSDVFTIVGVVGDAHYQSRSSEELRPFMYFSWASSSNPPRAMTIVARVDDGSGAAVSLRGLLASLDRRLPVPAVTPMTDVLATTMATPRFALTLFSVFAIIAVTLAAIGIYGVLSYLVRQRTHEMGVRAALGASRARLVRLVVGGALRLTVAGLVVGIAAAYGLTRWMNNLLFNVSPTDLRTFIALPLLLAVVALLASLLPALRAARADPMHAVRGDG